MYFNNLTVREMYASITNPDDVTGLFRLGIRINNDRLAVSAMEELIRLKAYHDIVDVIDQAIENDDSLRPGSTLFSMMMNSLVESTEGNETHLGAYARAVLDGQFMGPRAWLNENPEKYLSDPRLGGTSSEGVERLSGGAMWLPGNDR